MRTPVATALLACLLLGCEGQAKAPASCADVQSDPQNCGACGRACPEAGAHAAATCVEGQCGTRCEDGWLDLQAGLAGCESPVTGVPESGLTILTPSSSTSLFQHAQESATHRNEAVVGDPAPLAVGGAAEQTPQEHRNVSGFSAFLHEVEVNQ